MFTKELEELLKEANEKLAEAQASRSAVMDYLEEHYDIDYNDLDYYDYLKNEDEWCYGINERKLYHLIEAKEQ